MTKSSSFCLFHFSIFTFQFLLFQSTPLAAQVPGAPDVKPMVVDAAKVKAAGLRVLEGKHLTLYTDVPSSPAVDDLPAVFDAAVPQWAAYFNIPAAKIAGWRMNGFLIGDKEKFVALGLIPIVGLGGFAGRAEPVVRAEQVELVTATGTRQAALNADSAGVTLTLFTRKGRPASALRLTDSTLTLLDASGRHIATLGGPMVRHLE